MASPTGSPVWNGFEHTKFPNNSAASPPACKHDCTCCNDQYVPLLARQFPHVFETEMHSDAEAAANLNKYITTARDNHRAVRDTVATYGDVLVKRWTKKSTPKRDAMLLKARPDIYHSECAEVELAFELSQKLRRNMEKSGQQDPLQGLKARHEACLLPYGRLAPEGPDHSTPSALPRA
ncbi:hypothetical protein LTR09_005578 [Extremus antarcticus]|uniref:Uncharacterized protein n=1 Tax=Extremus antarcticus TaxID=702011 RepID=A0AAJ0DG78_9PEZI|nr:hypothetical protein LTR09_005578 [Extremus antarcticus]